jgi:hypothetical protein
MNEVSTYPNRNFLSDAFMLRYLCFCIPTTRCGFSSSGHLMLHYNTHLKLGGTLKFSSLLLMWKNWVFTRWACDQRAKCLWHQFMWRYKLTTFISSEEQICFGKVENIESFCRLCHGFHDILPKEHSLGFYG